VIDVGAQLRCCPRHLQVMQLYWFHSYVVLLRNLLLFVSRPRFDAAVSAVVADVIHDDVIRDCGVVDIVNIRDVADRNFKRPSGPRLRTTCA
jgi:hypothetical protein